MDESSRDRRRFLGWAGAALGALAAAIAGVPVLGAALSPLLGDRKREKNAFVPVANLAELEMMVPKIVDLVSNLVDGWAVRDNVVVGSAWLIRLPNDQVVAYSAVCPHLGCPVGFNGTSSFRCPCHDSYFKLDGTQTSGPSPRGLDTLEVAIKDGVVSIRPARFKVGIPAKVET